MAQHADAKEDRAEQERKNCLEVIKIIKDFKARIDQCEDAHRKKKGLKSLEKFLLGYMRDYDAKDLSTHSKEFKRRNIQVADPPGWVAETLQGGVIICKYSLKDKKETNPCAVKFSYKLLHETHTTTKGTNTEENLLEEFEKLRKINSVQPTPSAILEPICFFGNNIYMYHAMEIVSNDMWDFCSKLCEILGNVGMWETRGYQAKLSRNQYSHRTHHVKSYDPCNPYGAILANLFGHGLQTLGWLHKTANCVHLDLKAENVAAVVKYEKLAIALNKFHHLVCRKVFPKTFAAFDKFYNAYRHGSKDAIPKYYKFCKKLDYTGLIDFLKEEDCLPVFKFIDFGQSRILDPKKGDDTKNFPVKSKLGTEYTMSPEIYYLDRREVCQKSGEATYVKPTEENKNFGISFCGHKADMYAFARTLLCVLVEKPRNNWLLPQGNRPSLSPKNFGRIVVSDGRLMDLLKREKFGDGMKDLNFLLTTDIFKWLQSALVFEARMNLDELYNPKWLQDAKVDAFAKKKDPPKHQKAQP